MSIGKHMSKYLGPNKFAEKITPEKQAQADALRDEIAMKRLELYDLDPSAAPGGKRAIKRDKIMDNLVELSLANKELKRVGWMNCRGAAEDYLAKANQKFIDKGGDPREAPNKDWWVEEKEVTGDGVPDIIIRD